jgi:hypothetical protein
VPKIKDKRATKIKTYFISKNTLEIAEIHLIKKVKIIILGKIEKATVVANGEPS